MCSVSDGYDVDYFIEKFEAIPEELWLFDGEFVDANNKACRCALGHCGARSGYTGDTETTPESDALAKILSSDKNSYYDVASINDFPSIKYPQRTPKQRILAALRDVKAKAGA